ncbi:MAG: DUF2244 domain-containing protein [Alphaproteobacteria bacterium]
MTAQNQLYFDAVLHPHRSLSATGFLVLMIAVSLISFVAGMFFLLHGAWPVLGFFGLDVLLIYVAFKLSFRAGRQFETLRLDASSLELRRVAPNGNEQAWRLEPYWARVSVDEKGTLHLTSHGRDVAFGAFLNEDERDSLRDALSGALRRWRKGPAATATP